MLIDEGVYLGSVRTRYRVLRERGDTTERRNQRPNRSHATPHLVATKPNEVSTWDITKLATTTPAPFRNTTVSPHPRPHPAHPNP